MKINGDRIYLKIFEKKDIDQLTKLAHDKTISKFTRVPYPYKKNHAIEYLKIVKKGLKDKTEYFFGIFDKKTNKLMGNIGLKDINKCDKRGDIGYWIGKPYRKKGIVIEALNTLINYCFNKLKLNKITIHCMINNKPGLKTIKKIGAKKEGLLKQHGCCGGKFRDLYLFRILKKEWQKQNSQVKL